jgi:hypothetical protein
LARAFKRSTPVMMLRASARSITPAGVSLGQRPLRSNSSTPICASRLPTVSLTTDCARSNLRDAAEKLPSSTAAMKVRN